MQADEEASLVEKRVSVRAGKVSALVALGAGAVVVVAFSVYAERPTRVSGAPDHGVVAVSAPLGDSSLLYLVDHSEKKLLVFLVHGQRLSLRLLAVRNYTWDMEMDDFNNEGLIPETVKASTAGNREAP